MKVRFDRDYFGFGIFTGYPWCGFVMIFGPVLITFGDD